MGLKVQDDLGIKFLKQCLSGTWDVMNYSFNRGSENVITFVESANRDHEERVRISRRFADTLQTFGLTPWELSADNEAAKSKAKR